MRVDTPALTNLRNSMSRLNDRDQEFALSLLTQGQTRDLSDKQMAWVKRLIDRAHGQEEERETIEIGGFNGIADLFNKAKVKLKWPKINLSYRVNETQTVYSIRLSMAGERARVPGSINVVNADTGEWYGRILQSGKFEKSPRCTVPSRIDMLLKTFAQMPVQTAKAHAELTGNCCFCKQTLTDERSVQAGYGPVCADNYGLPWGGK